MKALTLAASAALFLAAPALADGHGDHAKDAMASGFSTGDTVENMTVVDSNGTSHDLSDFAGKTVVLEWTNHGCPYVKKHYNTDNMQGLQKEATADDVVWLSVVSSAPGKQGYVSGEEANTLTTDRGAAPTAVILDAEGVAGKRFAAKTTPHMYIIDGEGTLRYQGAIDDNPSSNPATVDGATNYVRVALAEMAAGGDVTTTDTQPYGCSVKY